jgi:hypothetical protein
MGEAALLQGSSETPRKTDPHSSTQLMANRRSSLQTVNGGPAGNLPGDESARGGIWARVLCGILLPLLIFSGCDALESGPPGTERDFDFSTSTHGWEAFFTDYPVGEADDMELTSGHRSLPDSNGLSGKGLFISGVNHSDDLKMLFRRRIEGLTPSATYRIRFRVEFATSAPSDCAGIGGAPGEAVKVIAAAEEEKPRQFVEEAGREDWYRLNVQHEGDPQRWYQSRILGHIANSRSCEEPYAFEMKTLTSEAGHDTVTTDEGGRVWLVFGTRSGFEGKTSLFYTRFCAELRRARGVG